MSKLRDGVRALCLDVLGMDTPVTWRAPSPHSACARPGAVFAQRAAVEGCTGMDEAQAGGSAAAAAVDDGDWLWRTAAPAYVKPSSVAQLVAHEAVPHVDQWGKVVYSDAVVAECGLVDATQWANLRVCSAAQQQQPQQPPKRWLRIHADVLTRAAHAIPGPALLRSSHPGTVAELQRCAASLADGAVFRQPNVFPLAYEHHVR